MEVNPRFLISVGAVVLLGLWYCYLDSKRELEENGEGEDEGRTICVALVQVRNKGAIDTYIDTWVELIGYAVNELVNKPGIDLKLCGNWWEMRCIPALQRSHGASVDFSFNSFFQADTLGEQPDMGLIVIDGDSITITQQGHQLVSLLLP